MLSSGSEVFQLSRSIVVSAKGGGVSTENVERFCHCSNYLFQKRSRRKRKRLSQPQPLPVVQSSTGLPSCVGASTRRRGKSPSSGSLNRTTLPGSVAAAPPPASKTRTSKTLPQPRISTAWTITPLTRIGWGNPQVAGRTLTRVDPRLHQLLASGPDPRQPQWSQVVEVKCPVEARPPIRSRSVWGNGRWTGRRLHGMRRTWWRLRTVISAMCTRIKLL